MNTPGTVINAYDVIGITYDYDSYDSVHSGKVRGKGAGENIRTCREDR